MGERDTEAPGTVGEFCQDNSKFLGAGAESVEDVAGASADAACVAPLASPLRVLSVLPLSACAGSSLRSAHACPMSFS